MLRRRATTELRVSERKVLEIEYGRDVCGDFDGTLNRLQEFIGVSARPLSQRLRKLAHEPAHTRVANYAELCHYFELTPCRAFFERSGASHGQPHQD